MVKIVEAPAQQIAAGIPAADTKPAMLQQMPRKACGCNGTAGKLSSMCGSMDTAGTLLNVALLILIVFLLKRMIVG